MVSFRLHLLVLINKYTVTRGMPLQTVYILFNISDKSEAKSVSGKTSRNPGMIHFGEISEAHPPYSILQHVGRIGTPGLCQETVLDTCKQH